MLIIQIALGIVAGYLLLQFLDSVIALVVIAILLAVGLVLIGGLFVAAYEYPGLLVLLVLIAGGIAYYVWQEIRLPSRRTKNAIEEMKKTIESRTRKGYDVSEQHQALRMLQEKMAYELKEELTGNLQDERDRRKRLGYDQ